MLPRWRLLVLITINTAPIDSQVANRGETRALPLYLLFDLKTDPGERHDVAQQHFDLVRELRALVGKWEADVDAENKGRVTAR